MVQRISQKHLENKIEPLCCAVADEETKTKIHYDESADGMEIGLLNQSGSVQQDIYVKTIDSLFVDKKVTFIKMDIEGEEKAALVGGGHVIKKNNPKLMISGYHKI